MTDQTAHCFLPGDRVSGKVILIAKGDEKIKDISVNFKGSLFTKYTAHNWVDTYRFNIFNLNKTLLQGPAKMPASTYEYPFFFEVPTGFTSPVAWEGYSKPGDLYSHPPGSVWPTPPTFEDAKLLHDSHTDWNITYTLTAQAKKTMLNLGDELPIIITRPPTLNRGPGILRQEARDDFTQNIKHSTGNYRLRISVLAQPTTAIIIGKPFTIAFTLQGNSPEFDYNMPLPEIQLKDYTMNLHSSTTVAVPIGKKFLSCSALCPFEFFPDKRIVNTPMRFNEPVHMQETLPSSFRSPPSFKTVLLERRYYFQINAHVSCLDKTAKLKILLPFWLHPSDIKEASAVRSLPLAEGSQLPGAYTFSAVTNTSYPNHQHPIQHGALPSPYAPMNNLQISDTSVVPRYSEKGRFCVSCGTPIVAAANFCTQCGSRI